MRNNRKTIIVALDLNLATCRDILSGIFKFAQNRPLWAFKFVYSESEIIRELKTDKALDGAINTFHPNALLQQTRHLITLPIVTFCLPHPKPPCATVPNRIYIADDNRSISQVAYNHIKTLGRFKSYAYVHPVSFTASWSDERAKEFVRLLKKDGERPLVFGLPGAWTKGSHTGKQDDLGRFLLDLPKPAAVFCSYDLCAQNVINMTQRNQISIPEEMTVIGVDNDEIICESTRPRITSVRADHVGVGFVMARELDRLMKSSNRKTSPKFIRIPALDVIVRETSAPLAPAATYLIQRALDFIEKNTSGHLRVEDVAKHLGVSRRLLEYRFAEYESRSIASAIRTAWLNRAKKLLSQTTANSTVVAHQLGFANPKSFHAIFTREIGTTPGAWKRRATKSKNTSADLTFRVPKGQYIPKGQG